MSLENLTAVEIEVNSNCNRSCSYCPNSSEKRIENGNIKFELYQKIVSELKINKFKGRLSYHFYGEPLLNKSLEKLISFAKKEIPKAKHVIFTNGDFLTRERVNTLIQAGVDYFIITRHEGRKHLPADDFYEDLPSDIKEILLFKDIENVNLSDRAGLVDLDKLLPKKQKPITNFPCLIPTLSIYITVKGHILPCFEDYTQKEVMGNIENCSLKEIWESPRYVQFRKEIKSGNRKTSKLCENCKHIQMIPVQV